MQVIYRVYRYDELPTEGAKARALNWLREDWPPFDWWEVVLEEVKEAGALLGITVENIYFDLYRRRVGFDGEYHYRQRAIWAVAQEWPGDKELLALARALQEIQRPAFYSLWASIYTTPGDDLRIVCYGEKGEVDTEALEDCLQDFARWILQRLEREYDAQLSEDVMEDFLIQNEFYFLADGSPAKLPQEGIAYQEESNAA